MSKPTTLPPPDITVTRDDVLALPLTAAALMPDEGYTWKLDRNADGRLRWVEVWGLEANMWRVLRDAEVAAAERVFILQTALASDAALADIGCDNAAEVRTVIRATMAEETGAAIHRLTSGRVCRHRMDGDASACDHCCIFGR